LEVIREKKLILSDLTRKIIYQHHEKYNGMGYPKKIGGDRICIEAQISVFSGSVRLPNGLKKGKPRVSPRDAIKQILNDCSIASKMDFDIKLVKKVQACSSRHP
jgi:hypothetical protein